MIPKVQLSGLDYLQLCDVVLLGLIANGIDNRPELVRVSGIAQRQVYRRLLVLTGASQYVAGKGLSRELDALVASRPHPHQQGKQLAVTELGLAVLQEIEKAVRIK